MIIEGTIVNHVAAALIELPDIYNFTAVALKGGDAVIFLHYTTLGGAREMFNNTAY